MACEFCGCRCKGRRCSECASYDYREDRAREVFPDPFDVRQDDELGDGEE